jgi:GxxExxY protein
MKQEEVEEVEVRKRYEISEAVIGCAMAVHSALGPGLVESCYASALHLELTYRSIRFSCEHSIDILYREQMVGRYRLDLLVEDSLIVELKSVESLLPLHTAQVLSYLRAASLEHGLLINFNVSHLRNGLKRVSHPTIYRASHS